MRIAFVGLVALAMAWLSAAGGLRASEFNDGLIAYLDSNYDLARRYWLPLAEAGDADSQFAIGMLHEQGQGVAIDHAGAAVWYRKAAEQGHADAQLSLGSLYSTGQGVVRDHGVAARWYFAAARQGNPQALYKLAEAYLFGLGVMPDRDRAGQLLRTAADQGYGRARQRLDMLGMPLGGARADFADGFDAPAADEAVGAPEAGGQVANEVAGTEPGPEPATAGEGGDDTSATMLNEPAVEAPRQEARTSATNAGSASEQQRAARLVTADNRPAPWPYALRLATYESADSAARGWQELAERFADVLGGLGAEIHRKDVGSASFYRVEAGPVADEATAADLCLEIAKAGQYCYPVRR